MKPFYFFIAFVGLTLNCFSQQTTLPLFENGYRDIDGAYYKDLDNDFGKFVGTWKFTTSNTSLTLILKKKIKYYDPDFDKYYDLIIGEYKYEVNGEEQINTLPNFNQFYSDPYKHNIVGLSIVKNFSKPACENCSENERRINLVFDDPSNNINGLSARVVFRRIDEGGQANLEMKLYQNGNIIYSGDTPPENPQFTVPFGEYVLTKIN